MSLQTRSVITNEKFSTSVLPDKLDGFTAVLALTSKLSSWTSPAGAVIAAKFGVKNPAEYGLYKVEGDKGERSWQCWRLRALSLSKK